MRPTPIPSRRSFLRTTAAALVSASALQRTVHASGADAIQLGLVGTGGRGTGALANLLSVDGGGVRLVAMADIRENRLKSSHSLLVKQYGNKVDVPDERKFLGILSYTKVIECLRPGDLVVIATPPVFHPLHFEAAVARGMNVFLEHPCCVDGPGYRTALKAAESAEKKNLKVGVGHQYRHSPRCRGEIARLHDGAIGDIRLLEAYRCHGPIGAPARMEDEPELLWQLKAFQHFAWTSGDRVCTWLLDLLDLCHWVCNSWPMKVRGTGSQVTKASADLLDQAPQDTDTQQSRCYGDALNHFELEYTYPNGERLRAEFHARKANKHRFGVAAVGTKGNWTTPLTGNGLSGRTTWDYPQAGGNPYQLEMDELIAAIRDDKPYNEARRGAQAALTAVMGRMAAYTGQEVTYDEAMTSDESYYPEGLASLESQPPTSPDKFGDYAVPFRAPTRRG